MRNQHDRDKFDYINKLFAKENDQQSAIRKQIILDGEKPINIEPYEGKLLSLLMQVTSSSKILEFGTMYGYSASWLLKNMKPNDLLVTIEKDKDRALIAKNNLKHENLIIINQDARFAEDEITKYAPYDMVFIDANKSAYKDYFDISDRVLKVGGVIIADNCLCDGIYQENQIEGKLATNINNFNHYVSTHPNYSSVLIPTTGGLLYSLKIF